MRTVSAFLALLLALLGANSLFVVNEGQTALLLQFGRIVGKDYRPGIHFKLPFMQQALRFDQRVLGLDAQPERYFTSEKKSVIVDFYVKWRIDDVTRYYGASAGEELQANQRLAPEVQTVTLISKEQHTFLSSTTVREIASLGGDISTMVPLHVEAALRRRFRELGGEGSVPLSQLRD